ncbi:2,3-diaminopropionate biosynthesis protein SbnA [Streptomyces sp. NPDC096323]|uniref:2,3-diaminopropionate biosynthesis protein SbnA n=1 Tax=Streptomyces sp. NPDC096323 TaxID=3155822 RepID=UPI003329ECDD
MIFGSVHDVVTDDLFLNLHGFHNQLRVLLKLEGLNPAGSVKLKTAVALVEDLEERGLLKEGSRLIESTSGNLGVALSMVCAAKRYRLTVVTDPNANAQSIRLMQVLGADLVVVRERDANGGFLQTRIRCIERKLAEDPGLIWLDQYANQASVAAHAVRTAHSIRISVGDPDYLFVGTGTAGTLMGCAAYFGPPSRTKVVAVDSVGSVTFGEPAGPRHIPGLGSSREPQLFDEHQVHRTVSVPEESAVRMCRRLAADYGLLVGGSTGTVLAAVEQLAGELEDHSTVVVISPDFGDRYLDTVYDDGWADRRLPDWRSEPAHTTPAHT